MNNPTGEDQVEDALTVMKKLTERLPTAIQREWKQFRHRDHILHDMFVTAEPEYKFLDADESITHSFR